MLRSITGASAGVPPVFPAELSPHLVGQPSLQPSLFAAHGPLAWRYALLAPPHQTPKGQDSQTALICQTNTPANSSYPSLEIGDPPITVVGIGSRHRRFITRSFALHRRLVR